MGTRRDRRLLLTNYDIGIAVPAHALQLGLNFAATLPELFPRKEMGEDALRVLNHIIPLQTPFAPTSPPSSPTSAKPPSGPPACHDSGTSRPLHVGVACP